MFLTSKPVLLFIYLLTVLDWGQASLLTTPPKNLKRNATVLESEGVSKKFTITPTKTQKLGAPSFTPRKKQKIKSPLLKKRTMTEY